MAVKGIGADFLRPDAFPGVNHMRGMYQIILNMALCPKFVCIIPTQNGIKSQNATAQLIQRIHITEVLIDLYWLNDAFLLIIIIITWVKAVMQF